jgi:hypothetical protein
MSPACVSACVRCCQQLGALQQSMLAQLNGHAINNHGTSTKCAEIESKSPAALGVDDASGPMAAATGDKSVAEIHNGCTPVETSNSSAGATVTTMLPDDENGGVEEDTAADGDELGTVVSQPVTKRASRYCIRCYNSSTKYNFYANNILALE